MALADQAQQQLEAGDIATAAETIDKAIREQDDVPDLYLLKARIAQAANRPADMLQAYSQASDLEPNNLDALRGLARINFQVGRAEEAQRAVDRLLALNPADPTAKLVKGLMALSRCRADAALALAGQILANNPSDPGGLILKTRALFALGRDGEARAALADALKQAPRDESVLLTRLEMDRILADPAALKADFAAIRAVQPRNAELALQQLNLLYKSGDVAAARSAGLELLKSKALQADDLDRVARVWREYDPAPLSGAGLADLAARGTRPVRILAAQHYLEAGQAKLAIAVIAGLEGSDVAGLGARAQLLLGQTAQAVAAAEAVVAKDRTQCDALLALAGARMAAGQRAEASSFAENASAECPRQWLAYVMMADTNSGSLPQFDRITAAALDADPQNGALARALAQRWAARGMPDRAVAVARRVTRNAPGLVSGWVLFSDLCRRSHDQSCAAEAATGLERARKLYSLDPLPGQRRLLGGGSIGCRDYGKHPAEPERGGGST